MIGGIVIDREVWESIPADIREKLQAYATENLADLNQIASSMENKAIATMVDHGLTVVETTPAEQELWQTWFEPNRIKIRGLLVDDEMYDRILELRTELRAQDTN
jgi:TRAP-type C4-dicarboxylate transport system substrate-binding protein